MMSKGREPIGTSSLRMRGCACGCDDTISLTGAALKPVDLSRRQFVGGAVAAAALAATGLGAGLGTMLAPFSAARAQSADTKPYRIDVHHHLSPPSYIEASVANNFGDGLMRKWTPEKSIADMDAAGVAVSMLSVSQPGVNFTSGEAARKMCRACNDYAAKLVADHPGRFGAFAMIPLTDTEGSLKEIAYALDTLKFDGIGLMTNYRDKWLGDPSFRPVMEELNRRKCVVYTHPSTADCCVNLLKTEPPTLVEWGTDTTRTIGDIVFSGNAQKFRDIKWIFSHAGGTMPFLIERFVRQAEIDATFKPTVPDGALAELTRFYYDTAQTANKASMSALAAVIPTSQILFGTDFPYRTALDHVKGLRASGVFTDAQIMDIERNNAQKLLPRLKA
jgi:predicted TIM-barrel fold metal-dependent hydrolase